MITGGLGKDSGELWDSDTSEAKFVAEALFRILGTASPNARIVLESKSMTGEENVRLGRRALARADIVLDRDTVVVAHATSLRRLAGTMAATDPALLTQIGRAPTAYPFNPEDPDDQTEAVRELRMVERQAEEGIILDEYPPTDLVDFARSTGVTVPARPPRIAGPILRRVPRALRKKIVASRS